MSEQNTVNVTGTNPKTSTAITVEDAVFSDEQREVVEGMLRQTEQQVLRYLGREPRYAGNAVTEDQTWGYG